MGSPHCASMCGPIALNFAGSRLRLALYQGGRLIAYVAAGAAFGAAGNRLLERMSSPWIAWAALAAMAALLFAGGARAFQGGSVHRRLPRAADRALAWLWRLPKRLGLPPAAGAGLSGALSILLPCGHLHAFLLGAAASGSAARGAAFMAAFWLGGAPLLVAGALGLRALLRSGTAFHRRMAAAALVAAGAFSLLAFGAQAREASSRARDAVRSGARAGAPSDGSASLVTRGGRCH